MNPLLIILARAGSKGLPQKNTWPVAGRPCIEWTFDHALDACLPERVVLSTDDPIAADLAHARDIRVLDRPRELATDTATIDAAARHALDLVSPHPTTPVVILYANVPVRPPGLIVRALNLLETSRCHSVQSYEPVGKHHPWWTVRFEPDAVVKPWEGDVLNHNVFRRQDLPPAYIPDGGVIALTQDALRLRIPDALPGPHAFLGLDRRGIINPPGSVIDIDTEIDRLVAEATLHAMTIASSG